MRYSVGEANGRPVCRMCKVMAVDLHGKVYKLQETGENCTVRLSLLCGGQVSFSSRLLVCLQYRSVCMRAYSMCCWIAAAWAVVVSCCLFP